MTIWKGKPPIQLMEPTISKPKEKIKLSDADAKQIKNFLEKNYSVRNIARMFGVKDSIIYGIKKKGKPAKLERQPPFEIEEKKLCRLIAYSFEWEFCKGFKKEFTISHNNNNLDESTITGIVNDYKLKCKCIDPISLVSERCNDLNLYFF